MNPADRRAILLLASSTGLGLAMSAIVWLFVSEASPAYRYLLDQHDASYGLLILNLPAMFVSRVLSGTPPAPALVYFTCFVQWFGISLAVSSAIWRKPPQAELGSQTWP